MKAILDKSKREIVCSAILTEIKQKSAYVFTQEKLPKNSMLEIQLREPLSLDLRCRVRYSEPADRKVNIKRQESAPIFRTLLEFVFASEFESEAMMVSPTGRPGCVTTRPPINSTVATMHQLPKSSPPEAFTPGSVPSGALTAAAAAGVPSAWTLTPPGAASAPPSTFA